MIDLIKTLFILICDMENLGVLIGTIALKSSTRVTIHWTLIMNWFHDSYRLIHFLGIYMFYIIFFFSFSKICFWIRLKKGKVRYILHNATVLHDIIVFVVNKIRFTLDDSENNVATIAKYILTVWYGFQRKGFIVYRLISDCFYCTSVCFWMFVCFTL